MQTIVQFTLLMLFAFYAGPGKAEAYNFLEFQYALENDDAGLPVSLFMDVYLPADDLVGAPYPAVIWSHEGGWTTGDRGDLQPAALPWLIPAGIAVISIDYRLGPASTFPKPLHDVKGAVRFVRARIDSGELPLDTNRIALWGASAGGHLSLLAAATQGNPLWEGDSGGNTQYSSEVIAVCNYYGPSNILAARLRPPGTEVNLLGGPVADNPLKATLASPIFFTNADFPHYLGVLGLLDPFVPQILYTAFEERLIEVGAQNSFKSVYLNAGHGVWDRENNPWVWISPQLKTELLGFFLAVFNLAPAEG